jgi:hypothetical protein
MRYSDHNTWNHFVAASDEYLRQMAKDFGKENKCQVKIDFIPHRDTPVKVAKEQETREARLPFFSSLESPNCTTKISKPWTSWTISAKSWADGMT